MQIWYSFQVQCDKLAQVFFYNINRAPSQDVVVLDGLVRPGRDCGHRSRCGRGWQFLVRRYKVIHD